MESFSWLRYGYDSCSGASSICRTTVANTLFSRPQETNVDDEDEVPYLDLKFHVPDGNSKIKLVMGSIEDVYSRGFRVSVTSDRQQALMRRATKHGVFMPRFMEPNTTPAGVKRVSPSSPKRHLNKFLVKLKVVEVPTLFCPDNSNRARMAKPSEITTATKVLHKYLKKMYKRYGENWSMSGLLSMVGFPVKFASRRTDQETETVTETKTREVDKRLGRSTFTFSEAVPPSPQRRDDSLVQHEDGIQSAIAHCKHSLYPDRYIAD